MKFLRVIFLLIFISTPLFSQWFWEEHYYEIEIPFDRETYYAKGKPRIEGEFTIFNKWPENLEWRVKTQNINVIKDIGPDSPEVLETKAAAARAKANAERYNLLSIFKPLLSLNDKSKLISLYELNTARERNYSEDEIWSVLKEQSQLYSEAKKSGFTLDAIAKFFDEEAKQ